MKKRALAALATAMVLSLSHFALALDKNTPANERKAALSSIAKELSGEKERAAKAGEKLGAILDDALASSPSKAPSDYLLDTVGALSAALEEISARDGAQQVLENRIDALLDDSSAASYEKLNLLMNALARQNVGLMADSVIEETTKKALKGYGEAITSSNSGERRRGSEGFAMAFESFLNEGGRGNLWNRRRAEKFFEGSAEKIEKALRSRNEKISLDAANLAVSLLAYSNKLKLAGRAERLRKTAVESLSAILEGGSSAARADSAEALGEMGDKAALPALQKALSDKDGQTAKKAAESIEKITGKKPVK